MIAGFWLSFLNIIVLSFSATEAPAQTFDDLFRSFRIDHVNIAVADLDSAQNLFREKHGFTIKSGRLHRNTILNAHMKFSDGSSLELITAKERSDSMSSWYVDFIATHMPGATAFAALRIEKPETLEALKEKFRIIEVPFEFIDSGYAQLIVFPESSTLHPLFFIYYTRPPVDRVHYLQHTNGSQRIVAVWLPESLFEEMHAKNIISGYETETIRGHEVRVVRLASGALYFTGASAESRIPGVTIEVGKDADLRERFQFEPVPGFTIYFK